MTRRLGEDFYSYAFVVSFRIDRTTTSQPEYLKRLNGLEAAVAAIANEPVWKAPSSCFVFKSGKTIDEIAACLARAIDHQKDVVLVAQLTGPQSAPVLIGNGDDDFGTLRQVLPGARKLG